MLSLATGFHRAKAGLWSWGLDLVAFGFPVLWALRSAPCFSRGSLRKKLRALEVEKADIVVGADGIHSVVKKDLGRCLGEGVGGSRVHGSGRVNGSAFFGAFFRVG